MFNIEKWLRRFYDQRIPYSEKLGMLRSIPHLEYRDGKELVAIVRRVLMPLADGLANDTVEAYNHMHQWRDSQVTVSKLRVEAWFLLTELFFNTEKCPCIFNRIACEGFVDDVFVFFRKNLPEFRRSNTDSIQLARPLAPGLTEDEIHRQMQEDQDMAERVKRAHQAMLGYLNDFFIGIWDFKKLIEYVAFDRTQAEEIHEEISCKRRIEIFRNLININPEWVKDLPWTKESFVSVVDFILDEVKAGQLSDVARLDQFGENEHLAPLIRSSRHLIQIAFENGWSNFEGVLIGSDDSKQ
jgi:hypothetical protein